MVSASPAAISFTKEAQVGTTVSWTGKYAFNGTLVKGHTLCKKICNSAHRKVRSSARIYTLRIVHHPSIFNNNAYVGGTLYKVSTTTLLLVRSTAGRCRRIVHEIYSTQSARTSIIVPECESRLTLKPWQVGRHEWLKNDASGNNPMSNVLQLIRSNNNSKSFLDEIPGSLSDSSNFGIRVANCERSPVPASSITLGNKFAHLCIRIWPMSCVDPSTSLTSVLCCHARVTMSAVSPASARGGIAMPTVRKTVAPAGMLLHATKLQPPLAVGAATKSIFSWTTSPGKRLSGFHDCLDIALNNQIELRVKCSPAQQQELNYSWLSEPVSILTESHIVKPFELLSYYPLLCANLRGVPVNNYALVSSLLVARASRSRDAMRRKSKSSSRNRSAPISVIWYHRDNFLRQRCAARIIQLIEIM